MRYNRDNCSIELSVRELCELSVHCPDLGVMPFSYGEIPLGEKQLFFKLQSEAGAYYNTDRELSCTSMLGGIYFTVSSKADGVIKKEDGTVTVDRIKCVKGRAWSFPPDELTLASLKCSAYLLCVCDGIDVLHGRVSFYNTDTGRLKYFRYRFTASELRLFYLSLLEKVKYRAEILREREEVLLPSAENAVFPYSELRPGQESMIRECYLAMKNGKRIFVEAPTGTGKTMSSLFPAVKALGKGYCHKIFYLTPKTSTRREAFAAAAKLCKSGTELRTVMISAKEQVCPVKKGGGCTDRCAPELCPFAKGYYDRRDSAMEEMLKSYRGYSRSFICSIAQKYSVCPYELSLDLSELCDIIICDYNYAFDPFVYFRRYFGKEGAEKDGRYVFLIDEAHNLADRAREMYSAEIKLSDIRECARRMAELYGDTEETEELLGALSASLIKVKKLCRDELVKDEDGNDRGFYISGEPIPFITSGLTSFYKKAEAWIRKNGSSPALPPLFELWRSAGRYLKMTEYFDGSYRSYAQIYGGDISVRLYCLDPSDIMNGLLNRAVSSVMFSATLAPADYFQNVLGCAGRGNRHGSALSLALPSPFSPERLCVAVADYIDTRFEKREGNAKRYASVIAATVSAKAGNYIAYFPSYACLDEAYRAFAQKYPKVETAVQKRHMTASEKESFLSFFKEDSGHLRVGFCVLGGVFSEGVDLPGSRLIGVVIFGVGLPGISNERNMIKEYYDLKSDEGIGYDYAYTFPGMNNVLQASGRVIRRDEDCGVVVLADDRYALPKYRALFPKHWQEIKYAGNASSLAEIIRIFRENTV